MCQALRVRPRKIGNTLCRINHFATKEIALGPGTFRPSILFLIIVFIGSSYRIIFKNVSHLTKYLFSLSPKAPLIYHWQYLSKIAILARNPDPSADHKTSASGPLLALGPWVAYPTPVLRIWINEYCFPYWRSLLENWVWERHRLRRSESLVLQPQCWVDLSQLKRESNQRPSA